MQLIVGSCIDAGGAWFPRQRRQTAAQAGKVLANGRQQACDEASRVFKGRRWVCYRAPDREPDTAPHVLLALAPALPMSGRASSKTSSPASPSDGGNEAARGDGEVGGVSSDMVPLGCKGSNEGESVFGGEAAAATAAAAAARQPCAGI